MHRRAFLGATVKASVAGLIVGDAALELAERLAWVPRRLWTGWGECTATITLGPTIDTRFPVTSGGHYEWDEGIGAAHAIGDGGREICVVTPMLRWVPDRG